MSRRITIDPVTGIEGHLRVEVQIENGIVKNAWSSGTSARGFEALLIGRDPRDAGYITSRFCGICFSVNQMASAQCLDAAFGAKVPEGGRILRNLLMGSQFLFEHILHFYQMSVLDYLDIGALGQYSGKDSGLNAIKDRITGLMKKGDARLLIPGHEPDQYSVNDPELVTMMIAHYLEALKIQVVAKNMGAVLGGGRTPHYQGIVVGGVTQIPNPEQIGRFSSMLSEVVSFVRNVYQSDVLAGWEAGTGITFPAGASPWILRGTTCSSNPELCTTLT